MKNIFAILLFVSSLGFSQSSGITYQAVIYNPAGEELPGVDNPYAPLTNQDVCLQFGIVDADGSVEYQEQVQVTTDAFGMVNLLIGTNSQTGGYAADFTGVEWSADSKFLKVDLDIRGTCSNFEELSNQPFTYVPFAYYSPASDTPGPEGPQGPAGQDGQDGATGPAGSTGQTGPAGANGQDGTTGPTGPQGPAGSDGVNGINGAAGADGATGPQGQDGVDGLDGATGPEGPQGIAGLDGGESLQNLIQTSVEFAGTNCANGGVLIESGIDSNANGSLDSAEITNSEYVCNGLLPTGSAAGEIIYWNGAAWQTISPGNSGAVLQMVSGIPTWVSNADIIPPIITVLAGTDVVEQGSTWTDAGATSNGGETVTASGTVDTSVVGTYTITYNATDAAGNTGTATRTVTVVDTTAPIITVLAGTDTVEQGSTWTDAGATSNGGETVNVSGTVDTNTPGTYTITYTATDAAGNTGTATRTVTVNAPGLSIGDFHQGGYIFYLDGNGGGLIAANIDQSSAEWGCSGTAITGADSPIDGAQNTIDILAGCPTPGIAADICANLSLNGYSDWYLPADVELRAMHDLIGPGSGDGQFISGGVYEGTGNVGGFRNGYYWCSTEITAAGNDTAGRVVNFTNGNWGVNDFKYSINSVRAVRAF